MSTVFTARQALCRWCRAPASALREFVELCKPCASVVDELAVARAAWDPPQHHEQRPTRLIKRNTMKGGA